VKIRNFLGHKVAKNVDIRGESVPKRRKEEGCETRRTTKKKRLNSCVRILHIFYEHWIDRFHAPSSNHQKTMEGGGAILRGWTR